MESIEYYCFICYDLIENQRKKKKIYQNYSKYFYDPNFRFQKECATKFNLVQAKKKQIQLTHNQMLDEDRCLVVELKTHDFE